MKPITPQEIINNNNIPDFVIEIVNNLIKEKFNYISNIIIIKQSEILNKILEKTSFDTKYIYKHKMLDFEPNYINMGWNVKYCRATLEDSFEPYFIFSAK